MRCCSPLTLKDPRIRRGSLYMVVPCGKCGACRFNRRVDWSFRLAQELRVSLNGYFLTLTYSDHFIHKENGKAVLWKPDFQKFVKRFRKYSGSLWKLPFRYYAVGEYGRDTGRPHYHCVAFNVHSRALDILDSIWKLGYCDVAPLNDARIHYVTKYHVNVRRDPDNRPGEFALMSRRPGIGALYVDRVRHWHNQNEALYVLNNGYKQRMPRYYREKVFSKFQLERLGIIGMKLAEEAEVRECERLFRLGYVNPLHELELRRLNSSIRVEEDKGGRL